MGLFFLGLTTWMVINNFLNRPWESLVGLATILGGLLLYVLFRRRS